MGASQYPSIRKLPQLGVTYADLMRNTKVDEAVFEALTQQYESAKVAEAKDLPTVKVLDQPQVPEEKSFPPRALISVGGCLLALGLGIAWVLGSEHWKQVDPKDPGKAFAQRVAADVGRGIPWISRNGRSAWKAWEPNPSAGAQTREGASAHGSNGDAIA